MDSIDQRLEEELNEAERKAWEALARYKFQMFGYWSAIWVHLNRIGNFRRPNPWKLQVALARCRVTKNDNRCVQVAAREFSALLSTTPSVAATASEAT